MSKKPLRTGFTGDVSQGDDLQDRAKSAVRQVKDEAGMVAAHAVDHPAATGSAVAFVGLAAFAIGFLLGTSRERSRSWYR